MNILYIINNSRRHESIQPISYILCKKDNGIILKNTILKRLENFINLLNESMIFNNQHIDPSKIDVTYDLTFLVIFLRKEESSLH